MTPDDDADIFASGALPDDVTTPSDNETLSSAITALHREGGRSESRTSVPLHPPPRPEEPASDGGPEDRSTAGLLKALLDERQTRQELARERDELKRWREEQERQRKESETPFDQRLFEKPQEAVSGVIDERVQPLLSQMQSLAMDIDFRFAKLTYGAEAFDEAFGAWYQQISNPQAPNPALYWHVVGNSNPGDAVVRWYKQARFMDDVGDDPDAYRARIEQEVLARYGLSGGVSAAPVAPNETRARAPNGQFTARHEVRLPTATSRVGRSGSGTPAPDLDDSEEAIFDAGRPPRNR